jgi:hypothetical protein
VAKDIEDRPAEAISISSIESSLILGAFGDCSRIFAPFID